MSNQNNLKISHPFSLPDLNFKTQMNISIDANAHIKNILNEEELNKYLKHIHHKDMPKLWTVEQTTKVGQDIGIDFDKWKYNIYTFNYVMNMMRADYYSEFKSMFYTSPLMKQTVLDSASFYAHLAKAWLNDEDAPADKAMEYIHLVTGEDTQGV